MFLSFIIYNFMGFFSVYANAMQENVSTLLYNGFIEELVDVLEVKDENLMVWFP